MGKVKGALDKGVYGLCLKCTLAHSGWVGQKCDVGLMSHNPYLFLSFGRDVKLGVPCLNAACIVGLN